MYFPHTDHHKKNVIFELLFFVNNLVAFIFFESLDLDIAIVLALDEDGEGETLLLAGGSL